MAIHTFTDQAGTPNRSDGVSIQHGLPELNIPELQSTLKLAGLLQTSLEVENVLNYFLETVNETIPIGGAAYEYENLDLNFKFGREERHTCSYRLRVSGEVLGELKFTRNKRFSEHEMEQLENFMYHLVYPLRNALMYQQALRAAQLDGLTGINNRTAFDQSLMREVELAHRHEHPLSLLVLDLDFFKKINDYHGHSAGDYVIKALVQCVTETMRSTDMLFRYGGEEFTLILTGTDANGAKLVAERIRSAIADYTFVYQGTKLDITASVGVASLARRDDAKRLFNKADSALYTAKENGRNCVHNFVTLHSANTPDMP